MCKVRKGALKDLKGCRVLSDLCIDLGFQSNPLTVISNFPLCQPECLKTNIRSMQQVKTSRSRIRLRVDRV